MLNGLVFGNLFCQTTGSFEKSITVNSIKYTLAFYVPTNYNSQNKYPLIIGLHGCGGTGMAYRNTLKQLSDSLNSIILCPDNNYSQFLEPQKQLLIKSIEASIEEYNIDSNSVYLTGFSCNGYVTYDWGLIEIYKFRGIIPFNAFLWDVQPTTFNFKSKMPVCICSGTDDDNFEDNQQAYYNLMANNSLVYFNTMQGIGHTTNFPTFTSEMLECFHFFDSLMPVSNIKPEIKVDKEVTIYPNPTSGNIFLRIDKPDYKISLVDINGKMIYQEPKQLETGLFIIDLKSIGLSKGIYFLKIQSSESISTQKILFK